MEIGLREWLIIIGIVVILVILFDGWRRMQSSKSKLKIQLDPGAAQLGPDDEEDSHPELLGPARVVSARSNPSPSTREPVLDDDLPSISAHDGPRSPRTKIESSRSKENDLDLAEPAPTLEAAPARKTSATAASSAKAPKASAAPVEEVLVINVISREPNGFRGTALLQSILESGLRFGDMNIFHRHESMTGNGEILFSMANAVKPGTFNLDEIDRFTTPAVSFFLGLPGPRHPKTAFDLMLATARKLSEELNAELKDDQRSVLTAQTIEHYRQRMAEFERRQMTLKR